MMVAAEAHLKPLSPAAAAAAAAIARQSALNKARPTFNAHTAMQQQPPAAAATQPPHAAAAAAPGNTAPVGLFVLDAAVNDPVDCAGQFAAAGAAQGRGLGLVDPALCSADQHYQGTAAAAAAAAPGGVGGLQPPPAAPTAPLDTPPH